MTFITLPILFTVKLYPTLKYIHIVAAGRPGAYSIKKKRQWRISIMLLLLLTLRSDSTVCYFLGH